MGVRNVAVQTGYFQRLGIHQCVVDGVVGYKNWRIGEMFIQQFSVELTFLYFEGIVFTSNDSAAKRAAFTFAAVADIFNKLLAVSIWSDTALKPKL